MTNKFVKKYMRLAKFVGEDQPVCLSRGIGSVIVDPIRNKEVSTGYNGPAKGVPHLDSYESLKEFVYPQLTDQDKENIINSPICRKIIENTKETQKNIDTCKISTKETVIEHDIRVAIEKDNCFAEAFDGCKTCPRRLVGAKSGERLDLCACAHSERNALLNATCNIEGFYLFAYCGTPCLDCTIEIINKGIKRVYCLKEDSGPKDNKYFSWRSEWQFAKAGVEVIKLERDWINVD